MENTEEKKESLEERRKHSVSEGSEVAREGKCIDCGARIAVTRYFWRDTRTGEWWSEERRSACC